MNCIGSPQDQPHTFINSFTPAQNTITTKIRFLKYFLCPVNRKLDHSCGQTQSTAVSAVAVGLKKAMVWRLVEGGKLVRQMPRNTHKCHRLPAVSHCCQWPLWHAISFQVHMSTCTPLLYRKPLLRNFRTPPACSEVILLGCCGAAFRLYTQHSSLHQPTVTRPLQPENVPTALAPFSMQSVWVATPHRGHVDHVLRVTVENHVLRVTVE